MYLLGKCQSWLRYVCMYVFVMGKMFPLSTRDLLFNSVGYTQVVAQISLVSAAVTDFSTSNMFLFCVSSFTVQCVPFAGFGSAAASCCQGGSFGDGRVIFLFSSDSYLSRCCFCDVQLWWLWGVGGLADVTVLRVSFVGCLGWGYGWQVLHLQWK